MTDDKLTTLLDAIEENAEGGCMMAPGECVPGENSCTFCEALTMVKALRAVLDGHDPVQVYASADICGHERPRELDAEDHACWPEEAASVQFVVDAWDEDHPAGTPLTPEGDDPGRICLAKPQELICRACSEARYGDCWEIDGAYVLAADCTVRPKITAALTGEEKPGG